MDLKINWGILSTAAIASITLNGATDDLQCFYKGMENSCK